jgi:hypothetical protein
VKQFIQYRYFDLVRLIPRQHVQDVCHDMDVAGSCTAVERTGRKAVLAIVVIEAVCDCFTILVFYKGTVVTAVGGVAVIATVMIAVDKIISNGGMSAIIVAVVVNIGPPLSSILVITNDCDKDLMSGYQWNIPPQPGGF